MKQLGYILAETHVAAVCSTRALAEKWIWDIRETDPSCDFEARRLCITFACDAAILDAMRSAMARCIIAELIDQMVLTWLCLVSLLNAVLAGCYAVQAVERIAGRELLPFHVRDEGSIIGLALALLTIAGADRWARRWRKGMLGL